MNRGFFLGKFLPPHNGHLFVCDVARRYVDELTVFVCSYDAEPIDGYLRAAWMRECLDLPGINVIHMHRDIPQEPKDHPDFWQIWKDVILAHHPEPIDYVFGSEQYVYELAKVLDAKPFVVDQDRKIVPVSGTGVRDNPGQYWEHIPRPVRSHYQKCVTLLGAESTGKSSLSDLLAVDFGTKAIPEYGRDYDAVFKHGTNWTEHDFLLIAKGHLAMATAIAAHAGPLVVQDTDLLQTTVWSETLLKRAPAALVDLLHKANHPDLYLLLTPDMQWIDDGTRYHSLQEQRLVFHESLKHWLGVIGANWVEVSGSNWDHRHESAKRAILKIL